MDSDLNKPVTRVLLAGNAPDHRLRISLYLRHSGMDILTAQTGEEALQVTASHLPNLVLLDLTTTGMSCHEVCKRIKFNPATASTPVVILVADDSLEERIRGLQAGADDFFGKSIRRDEFLVRVRTLVERHQARNHLASPRPSSLPGNADGLMSGQPMDGPITSLHAANIPQVGFQNRFDAVILFADLRGFTRMAEKLAPAQVVPLLNEYFSLLTDVAYRYSGVIFNMAGDCLLVGFGVPFEQADAAERAINCALQMLAEFDALCTQWHTRYGLETGLGIGVNKGEVVAGNIGSAAYSNFTIIGDAVNIASRLMQRARAGELLLSDSVMKAVTSTQIRMDALPLPPLALPGRLEPIGMYCIPFKGRIDTRT